MSIMSLIGFGLLAALAALFKPLLTGAFRALKLLVKPRMSKEQRLARAYYRNAKTLHSMASTWSDLSPNMVAELHALSGRS